MRPVDAVAAVTYRCNARCAMCGIWKSPPTKELPPEAYRKLPAGLRDLNLTGGEPFLRDDLPEIHAMATAACPQVRTVVSTNGILTERILAQVSRMARTEPDLGIAVSIDGPREVHDRIRGVTGAYDRAMDTVRALKARGIRNLRLAFTATRENLEFLGETYRLAQDLGVEFTCAVEHSSDHYFHKQMAVGTPATDALREQLQAVMRNELRSFAPKRWGRAYFMKGLWDFASGRGRALPCLAGRDFFFLDPGGDVYTCNAAPYRMGNLAEQEFDVLWNSPSAGDARTQADRCQAGCWMVCTARTAIRRAWPRALAWAVWRKAFGVTLPR